MEISCSMRSVGLCDDAHYGTGIPIFPTNVTSVVGRDSAAVDDDAQNHEANAGKDLDHAENKLDLYQLASNRCLSCETTCLSIAFDSKDLNYNQSE